jgi:PDZ domain-containing protein
VTTVVETLQAGESPLGDPTAVGEASSAVGRAQWRLDGTTGPVVLLLESPDDLSGWPAALVASLVGRGLRVLAYDVLELRVATPAAVAELALAVIEGARVDRVHVVAASAGGLGAHQLAAVHASRVASLTFVMTRLPTDRPRDLPAGLGDRAAGSRPAGPASAARAVAITRHNAALSLVGSGRPDQRARSRRRASTAFERGADPVRELLRFAGGADDQVASAGTDIPALVLHGRDDPLISDDDAAALADHHGAPLYAFPAAHDLPWGVEDAVAERIAALVNEPFVRVEERRQRRSPWVWRLSWAAAVLVVLVVAGLIAASTITVPYYAIRPGTARQTNDLVVIPPEKRIPAKGQVLFVTVGVQRLRALQYVLAKRDPDVDVVPAEAILGKSNPKEYSQRSTQAMVDSKETAAVVAMERLCLPVQEKGTGARIEQVAAGSPADKAGLKAEDTIVAVASTPVTTADEALKPLRALKPGSPFTLKVVGPEEAAPERTINGTTGPNPTDATRSYLGVSLRTRSQDFVLPFEVSVESGRVGGPSAGLAFTLALLDQLTPGELTGGQKVAATGTIELDSSVGLVGGVPQKAVAVRESGAKLFLVPRDELKEARAKIGSSVEVVPVDTLEDAIEALKTHGGDVSGIPTSCPGS